MNFLKVFFVCLLFTQSLVADEDFLEDYGFNIYGNTLLRDWDFSEDFIKVPLQYLPNDISFFAIDFKVDKRGNLKILEFQDGPNAGFRSYDQVFEKGKIWKLFWTYIRSFNVPLWYVGPKPIKVKKNFFSHKDEERLGFQKFLSLGGRYVPTLSDLFCDSLSCYGAAGDKITLNTKSSQGVKGIVLLKACSTAKFRLRWLKSRFPEIIFVNERSRRYTRNKRSTNRLFQSNSLQHYRPLCEIYKKEYSAKLTQRILSRFYSDRVVIKPVNSSRSNGILVVERQDLDAVLRRILNAPIEEEEEKDLLYRRYRPKSPLTFDYWKGDKNRVFMVEEFIESNPIEVNEKKYDPTYRMALVMSCIRGRIDIQCLDGFKKIPRLALDDEGLLTDKHVSKHRSDLPKLPAEALMIGSDEMEELQLQFRQIFSRAYRKILVNN